MKTKAKATKILTLLTLLCVLTVAPVWARRDDSAARKAIERSYPGANIIEVEAEGKEVWEIDFEFEGEDFEAIVKTDGTIVKVEKDDNAEALLGIGLFHQSSIFRSASSETVITPVLLLDKGPFQLRATDGILAIYELTANERNSFSLLANLRMEEGFEVDESPYLAGMDEPSTSFEFGVRYARKLKIGELRFDVQRDVSNKHDGYEYSVSLVNEVQLGSWFVRPSLSFAFQDSDMTNYYYGVSPSEARLDRPAYTPDGTMEISLQAFFRRPLNERYSLGGLVEYTRYGSEVMDSPIVEKKNEFQVAFGVMFSFDI